MSFPGDTTKDSDQGSQDLATQPPFKDVQRSEQILADMPYHQVEAETSVDGGPRATKFRITASEVSRKNETAEDVRDQILRGGVLTLRPTWLSLMPYIIAALILTLIVFISASLILADGQSVPANAIFIPICLAAVIVHKRYNYKYMISDEGLLIVRGILGLTVKRVRVPYGKIGEIEVRKPLINRILFLDESDLHISVIMFDDPEVMMKGISNPLFYATLVRLLKVKLEDRSK